MTKHVKVSELFDCKVPYLYGIFTRHEYPWEILTEINKYILGIIENPPEGFRLIKPGVIAGKGAEIADSAVLCAPAVIGEGTIIRPGAYIRGNVITGRGCVLGNSSEYKNCILLDNAETPHYNYVGDSILGNCAHMGAGSICSNLKSDRQNVIIHADLDYDTGLRKVGGFLADGADVGAGCVINPGTVIGRRTSVYPLTSLRGVYPSDVIVKSQKKIVKRV